jgi:predicted  nucleic acid-binding Zn-ribbon protein
MKFLNKQNESYEMDDINDFCGLHELDIKALRKVINGEMKTHRGFRLAEPKSEKQDESLVKEIEELKLGLAALTAQLAPILKEREKAKQRQEEENPGRIRFGSKKD